MKNNPIDTNVIVRFLVENPTSIQDKFKGVYSFFERLEKKEASAYIPELVLFQTYFVLTSHYEVPTREAAMKLSEIVKFSGVEMDDKNLSLACMNILIEKKVDIIDAYICALCEKHNIDGVYSFDSDIYKLGLKIKAVK